MCAGAIDLVLCSLSVERFIVLSTPLTMAMQSPASISGVLSSGVHSSLCWLQLQSIPGGPPFVLKYRGTEVRQPEAWSTTGRREGRC
jgi:hypothetical protein